jgi:hypothetical protein
MLSCEHLVVIVCSFQYAETPKAVDDAQQPIIEVVTASAGALRMAVIGGVEDTIAAVLGAAEEADRSLLYS